MKTFPPPRRAVRFSELSEQRQTLIRLCQSINFGSLRLLEIREREPVFDPPPVLLVDVKLAGGATARGEIDLRDFVLRDEVVQLIGHLDRLVDTTIECLEVNAGIPRRARFILSPAAHLDSLRLSIRSPR